MTPLLRAQAIKEKVRDDDGVTRTATATISMQYTVELWRDRCCIYILMFCPQYFRFSLFALRSSLEMADLCSRCGTRSGSVTSAVCTPKTRERKEITYLQISIETNASMVPCTDKVMRQSIEQVMLVRNHPRSHTAATFVSWQWLLQSQTSTNSFRRNARRSQHQRQKYTFHFQFRNFPI